MPAGAQRSSDFFLPILFLGNSLLSRDSGLKPVLLKRWPQTHLINTKSSHTPHPGGMSYDHAKLTEGHEQLTPLRIMCDK